MTKEIYERPQIEEIGSLEELTHSTSTGLNIDAAFDAAEALTKGSVAGMVS